MKLLQINDKIINMDQVVLIQRKDPSRVWLHFIGSNKSAPDLSLNEEESIKLWDYLLNQSQNVME